MMSSPNLSKLKVSAQRGRDVFRMLPSSGHLTTLFIFLNIKTRETSQFKKAIIQPVLLTHFFSLILNNMTENKNSTLSFTLQWRGVTGLAGGN